MKTLLWCCWCIALLCMPVVVAGEGSGEAITAKPTASIAHKDLPVIFWAHYMPQVPLASLHSGGHPRGTIDNTPFIVEGGSSLEMYKRMAKEALASGINGFQFLTVLPDDMVKAAQQIKAETGEMFYLAPEWCGQGSDAKKAGEQIAKFAVKYKNNPHIFRINDKQVHFTYNHGKWSGDTVDNYSERVPVVKEILKKAGVDVMLIPTNNNYDRQILGRPELRYRSWPEDIDLSTGSTEWFVKNNWDGFTALNGTGVPYPVAVAVTERINKHRPDFMLVPAINCGYDSSNRTWQAIHIRYSGIRRFRNLLRQWIGLGYRQFTFSTWNDPNETMLLPSSRSPYGYSDLLRYYHSLVADKKSPFTEPRFVVAYDPEVLIGDQLYFQCLFLPETNTKEAEYVVTVNYRDLNDHTVLNIGLTGRINRETEDNLQEIRVDTAALGTDNSVLVPYVSVRRTNAVTGASTQVYENLRLPPVILRHDKIHFFPPYNISFAHVLPGAPLKLTFDGKKERELTAKTGTILEMQSEVSQQDLSLRKLILNESCLNIGAFRPENTVKALADGKLPVFIAIKASQVLPATLSVENGIIHNIYRPFWNAKKSFTSIEAPEAKFKTQGILNNPGKTRWVFYVSALKDAPIKLNIGGKDIVTNIAKLAQSPECLEFDADGKSLAVRIELTTDMADQNIDYPVAGKETYAKILTVDKYNQPARILFSWGLSTDNKVCYSRPLILVRDGGNSPAVVKSPHDKVDINWIQTNGIFDDFVNDTSSRCGNPFTPDDIRSGKLEAGKVLYYLLDMEEGTGALLNDSGTGNQLGRSWLSGDYEWVKDGWRGSALHLKGGKINFRSKSMPHGEYTFSARIKFDKIGGKKTAIFEDGDFYLGVRSGAALIYITEDGKLAAKRFFSESNKPAVSSKPVKKGWNHIVVTYDLKDLNVYLEGELVGSVKADIPSYQRTHSTPHMGYSSIEEDYKDSVFNGTLDQVELIGKALSPEEVKMLNKKGQWLSR